MAKKTDIVLLALARWDGPYASTAFALAQQLSRENRVFYVDNPFTLKTALTRFRTKQIQSRLLPLFLGKKIEREIDPENPNLINVTPRVVLPMNFLSRGFLYRILAGFNDFILTRAILSIIRKHQLSHFIFINSFNPFYLKDPTTLDATLTIYHCVDNIAESKYISKHGKHLEETAMGNYDITITTSKNLFEKARLFSKHVAHIPNAADFDHFHEAHSQTFDRPDELKGLEGKSIIGYIGNICLRLNYELLKKLAIFHHDKILLMIGPITAPDFCRYELDKQPNILTTGQKEYHELPRYMHYMDCTIIPFKCNELTRNIYPLKLNEYLAGGKPVVTTNFSPDLEDFAGIIRIEDTQHGFISKITEEIELDNENKRRRRIAIAKKNTWGARVEDLWLHISPFLTPINEVHYVSQEN